MEINDLQIAEDIVKANPQLSWVGWTIVHSVQDDAAEYDYRGYYDRNKEKWFRRISYPFVDGTGWVLPDSLIKI